MTQTITTAVAEKLANLSPVVNAKVVDYMVEKEIEKRSNAIVTAMDKLNALKNDLKKVKPDQVFYDDAGAQTRAEWSKSKLEEKNKLTQQVDKFEKALTAAIDQGDMAKVYELNKG